MPKGRNISTLRNEFVKPFDLSHAPLLRVNLVIMGAAQRVLLVDMHHIITDGISQDILEKEFVTLYTGKMLPPLKVQYKDYAQWQSINSQHALLKKQKAYWLKIFSDEIPLLQLPTDFHRPTVQSFKGNSTKILLSKTEYQALKKMTIKSGATLYMLILSIFTILLSKLSGQEDIIIGTAIAGRRHVDLEKIIGMFVNTLALRNRPIGDKKYNEFLEELKQNTLTAFDNQEYQFEDLIDQLSLNRDASRNPLFDIMFNFIRREEYPSERSNKDDEIHINKKQEKEKSPISHSQESAKFDLTLTAIDFGERISLVFNYCNKLFTPKTIERYITYLKKILNLVAKKPELKISQLEIISPKERKQILCEFNKTEKKYPINITIPGLFVKQVAKKPDNISIVGKEQSHTSNSVGNIQISYSELHQGTDRLALLILESGVKPGEIIALRTKRSIEMIYAILGTLKSGAAYLPLNPAQPEERTIFMIRDCGTRVLIQPEKPHDLSKEKIKDIKIISINASSYSNSPTTHSRRTSSSLPDPNPVSLAYVIYTSGSTGNPKGVPITHNNFSPLIHWGYEHLRINERERVAQNLAYYFDWSILELFTTLASGASFYLVPGNIILDSERYISFINRYKITVLYITPTHFQSLSHLGQKLNTLNYLCLGAEKLPGNLVERSFSLVKESCRLFNMYGPTETTIISAVLEIHRPGYNTNTALSSVPFGKPVGNTTMLIFDKYMKLCPVNVIGELYIGGDGLACGYLNKPELSAEKFCLRKARGSFYKKRPLHPHKNLLLTYSTIQSLPPSPIYRTGDLARWISDGNIEFMGRIDFQVKIRGFRIELGEIENQLLKYTSIKEAVLTCRSDENEEKYLCAYLVSDQELQVQEVRDYLLKYLPEYMVPAYYIRLDKMPLNPNGKIDQKTLPLPEIKVDETYTSPRNKTEEKLVEIWAEILGIEKNKISTNANFFQLGGHSLNSTILVSRIHKLFAVKIPLLVIFKNPRISELAKYIKGKKHDLFMSINPGEEKELYRLSPAQKRLYILQQMSEKNTNYNISKVIPLFYKIEKEKLEQTFKKLVKRHDSLRTSFITLNDEPVQQVHREVNFSIGYRKIAKQSDMTPLISSFNTPFDLSKAPLLKVQLIEIASSHRILYVNIHHIVTDGTSQDILEKEFAALYTGEKLPPLKLQYKDYALWQKTNIQHEILKKQKLYWLDVYADQLPTLELPTDHSRPLVQSFEGNSVEVCLTKKEALSLNRIKETSGTTLYMSVLSIFTLLLSKLSGQEDIIIGTAVAGRRHADLEKIIGMFVNTLALRNKPLGNKKYAEFLEELKQNTLTAFDNQEYQFEELIDQLSLNRDVGRNPLFDVMFNFVTKRNPSRQETDRLETTSETSNKPKRLSNYRETAKFDLTLTAIDFGERISLIFNYCNKLFTLKTIERYIAYFKKILKLVSKKPELRISQLEIISQREKKQILYEFNDNQKKYPNNKTIPELFAEQVVKKPDNIAIVGRGQMYNHERLDNIHISYQELHQGTSRLALDVLEAGMKPGEILALHTKRSIEMIYAILGTLKSSSAYLPINPEQPEERTIFMMKDCRTRVLIQQETSQDLNKEKTKDIKTISINASSYSKVPTPHPHQISFPLPKLNPENLAYIIYTSGSTGNPKGVPITHSNFSPLIHWGYEHLKINEKDRVAQNLSYYFDWSVWEIFIALTTGASFYLVPKDNILDTERYINFINRNRITALHITPTHFQSLSHPGQKLNTLRYLCIGAEKLTHDLVERSFSLVKESCRLFNMYGPTEATIISAVLEIHRPGYNPDKSLLSIPIGSPVGNTTLLIFNKYMKLCPVNIIGELFIGGDGLAGGYLNNPELSVEKFCLRQAGDSFYKKSPHPRKNFRLKRSAPQTLTYSPIYKTGDLARWISDGNIEFLGRIDHQVKIRGLRIELGEIESQLSKYPSIKDAVVTANENENHDKYLCAYIVLKKDSAINRIIENLAKKLPDYMIPSHFIPIEKLPLTPNGKIDRGVLPVPQLKEKENKITPRNKTENKLAELWSEVLNIKKDTISIDSDFFQLGGHSLKATILATKIKKVFHITVPLSELFKIPTIEALAQYIKTTEKEAPITEDEKLVMLKKGMEKTQNLFLIHDGTGEVEGYVKFSKLLKNGFTCWGIRSDRLINMTPRKTTIPKLAKEYIKIIKNIQHQGPYYITGWSLGGTIAYEIAAQLERMKDEIVFLALIDTPPPQKRMKRDLNEFNLKSELAFIKSFGIENEIDKKIKKLKKISFNKFWTNIADYLETNKLDIKKMNKQMINFGIQALPNYRKFTIKEILYYLNMARTLAKARNIYIPKERINTPIHYFRAEQSEGKIDHSLWEKYCNKTIIYHAIQGNHYSIFKKPDVFKLIAIFDKVLQSLEKKLNKNLY